MTVSNPREVPEYELNPGELQFRRGDEVLKARSYELNLEYNYCAICSILDCYGEIVK